jgi:transcriptional regulator with XRE-family HTH domain
MVPEAFDGCQYREYSVVMTGPQTPSNVVAARIQEFRKRRGLSAAALAAACAKTGHPQLTEAVIANIETGRRRPDGTRTRDVTVDELLAFAEALGIPAGALLPPLVTPVEQGMALTFTSRREFWAAQRLVDGFLTQIHEFAEALPPAEQEGH